MSRRLKIQIYSTDDRDYILNFKDFYINPPPRNVTLPEIEAYIEQCIGNPECQKVVLKKWNE